MIIWLYRLLFWPIFLLTLPYYLLRMIKRGGNGAYWWHRFGFVPAVIKTHAPVIWIQAVSVGEVEALAPLLSALKQRNFYGYLSTTTSTGFKVAHKKYSQLADQIAYFPLDFFNRIAWHRIHPQLALLMESELWPEHLHSARKYHVKALLINGRCSDRSLSRYKKFTRLSKYLLGHLSYILAASELDKKRYCEIGMPEDRVINVGNLKIDAAITKFTQQKTITRSQLQWDQAFILLGASTWPGEEELLIHAYISAKRECPQLKLILVPRHVERTQEVVRLLKKAQLSYTLRTAFNPHVDVCLVNTTGELSQFVALSDIIFIGKSLAPNKGGQTPIEAAAAGKPIIYGPNMQNFEEICHNLEQNRGALRCNSKDDVFNQLLHWIKNPQLAQTYGQDAQHWAHLYTGVTQRILPYIEQAIRTESAINSRDSSKLAQR